MRMQQKPLPGLSMRHLIIHCQPVRCDLDLGLFQRYRPGANLAVQVVFDAIFLVEAWRRAGCLRPEIRDIIRAAQLQADEMINLVLAGQVTCNTILGVNLVLFALWHVAHRARISLLANDVFGRVCEDGTGRTGGVLQAILSHTSRSLGLNTPVRFPGGWIIR